MRTKLILLMMLCPLLVCAQQKEFTTENFKTDSERLFLSEGVIETNIDIIIPPAFFSRNVLVRFNPVFVWGDNEEHGDSLFLQGEKCEQYCRIVSYKNGTTADMKFQTEYKRGMERGALYMFCSIYKKGKLVRTDKVRLNAEIDPLPMMIYETVQTIPFSTLQPAKEDNSQVAALLRQAIKTSKPSDRVGILRQAESVEKDNYMVQNNLALCLLEMGDNINAEKALIKAGKESTKAPEVATNLALLYLRKGNVKLAEDAIKGGEMAVNYNEIMGNILTAQGNYGYATGKMKGLTTNSSILAHILSQEYLEANNLVQQRKDPDGMTYYLAALLAVKQENPKMAQEALGKLKAANSNLYTRAKNSVEFANLKDFFDNNQ